MISDGFSVWSFILSRLASSSITKKVPEPENESNDSFAKERDTLIKWGEKQRRLSL